MTTKVSLKLLIDKKENRVLYGEADNTFIDFLFTILALPVGTVIKLLSTDDDPMVGSISNLFRSVNGLNVIDYFKPNRHTDNLLKPKNYYFCSNNKNCPYITATFRAQCPQCRNFMTSSVNYVYGSNEARPIGGGYVTGGKFMVMDDLIVKPMPHSSMSTISILSELNVEDVGSIEEKLVHFDINEGLKLLEASIHTTTVLTDMFLRNIDFSQYRVSIVKKE